MNAIVSSKFKVNAVYFCNFPFFTSSFLSRLSIVLTFFFSFSSKQLRPLMITSIFTFLQSVTSIFFALAPNFAAFFFKETIFFASAFFFSGVFAAAIAFLKATILAAIFFALVLL